MQAAIDDVIQRGMRTSAKIRPFSDEEGTKVADKGLCGNAGLRQGSVMNTTGGRWLCLVEGV